MKQEIEIEGLPEGWKAVAYRCPLKGENYLSSDGVQVAQYNFGNSWVIVEKIQPRRIVLEETEEDAATTHFIRSDNVFLNIESDKIWKEVKE